MFDYKTSYDPTDAYDYVGRDGTRYYAGTCVSPGVWATKDGRRMPIGQISDSHLENILLFLARKFVAWGVDMPAPVAEKILELKREQDRRRKCAAGAIQTWRPWSSDDVVTVRRPVDVVASGPRLSIYNTPIRINTETGLVERVKTDDGRPEELRLCERAQRKERR